MPTWAMDMPPVEGESSTIPFQILRESGLAGG